MRTHAARRPLFRLAAQPRLPAVAALAAILALPAAMAQTKPNRPDIYTCTTADGRKLTSDRPISECSSREQRVLNADGSMRKLMPPMMSPDEQSAYEARQRTLEVQRVQQQDAVRRDRNLMARYRDEAAHLRGREAALDDLRQAMQSSEKRLKDLATERKPLLDDAEFYKGKRLPVKLQHDLETNEAAAAAQRQSIDNQKAEMVRVNKLFDDDLARLRKLWAGAAPGSLDAVKPVTQPPPASR